MHEGFADIATTDDVIRFLQKHNLDNGTTLRQIAVVLLESDYWDDFIQCIGPQDMVPLSQICYRSEDQVLDDRQRTKELRDYERGYAV